MTSRDARSLTHEASAELRKTAVRMVLAGEAQRFVAESLQVHPVTVCKWMQKYEELGEELFVAREAPGPQAKLTERQILRLRRVIVGKNPDQLNFGMRLWTLPILGQLIESMFGRVLHATTIARMLNKIGITPQKPIRRAFQRDEDEVRAWLTNLFPRAVEKMKRKQATLLFLDETGIHEDHAVGTTWGARGQTPVVRVSGARRRINVISALSPRGRLWFRCYRGTLTAGRYVDFLRDLLHDIKGSIVLVHDRHPAHRAAATRRFIQENSSRLSVFELPAYAPDLNPDEHVWSMLKGMYRRDPVREGENFGEGVELAMTAIATDSKLIQSFFDHPAVLYVKETLRWR